MLCGWHNSTSSIEAYEAAAGEPDLGLDETYMRALFAGLDKSTMVHVSTSELDGVDWGP